MARTILLPAALCRGSLALLAFLLLAPAPLAQTNRAPAPRKSVADIPSPGMPDTKALTCAWTVHVDPGPPWNLNHILDEMAKVFESHGLPISFDGKNYESDEATDLKIALDDDMGRMVPGRLHSRTVVTHPDEFLGLSNAQVVADMAKIGQWLMQETDPRIASGSIPWTTKRGFLATWLPSARSAPLPSARAGMRGSAPGAAWRSSTAGTGRSTTRRARDSCTIRSLR